MSYIQRTSKYIYESLWPTPQPEVELLWNTFVSGEYPVNASENALKKAAEDYFFSLESQVLIEPFLDLGGVDSYCQPKIEMAKIFLEKVKGKKGFNLLEKLDNYNMTLLEVIFNHLVNFDIPYSYHLSSDLETRRSLIISLLDGLSRTEFESLYPLLLKFTAQKHILDYDYDEDEDEDLTTYLTQKISENFFSSFENLKIYYEAIEKDLDEYSFSYQFLNWHADPKIDWLISTSLEKHWIADSTLSVRETFKLLENAPVMQLFSATSNISTQDELFSKMISCLKGKVIKQIEHLFENWFEENPNLIEGRIIETLGYLTNVTPPVPGGGSNYDYPFEVLEDFLEKSVKEQPLSLNNLSAIIFRAAFSAAFSIDLFNHHSKISSRQTQFSISIKNILLAAQKTKSTFMYFTLLEGFLTLLVAQFQAQFEDTSKISAKDCQDYLASYDIDYDLLLDFNVTFLNPSAKKGIKSLQKSSKSNQVFKEYLLEEFLSASRHPAFSDYDCDYGYDESDEEYETDSSSDSVEVFTKVSNSLENGDHNGAANALERIRYRYYADTPKNSPAATAALFKGIEKSNIIVVKLLIEIGCSPLVENASGKSALSYAKELNRSPWFIQYLEDKVKELRPNLSPYPRES